MAEIDFFGSSFLGRSKAIDPSRMVNFFPEINPNKNAKTRVSIIGTPGLSLACTVGTGPMRALYQFGSVLYGLSGNTLYAINEAMAATAIGTLNTTSGPVSISDNGLLAGGEGGNQMIIVDGVDGYIWNPVTKSFAVISSFGSQAAGFPPHPLAVAYMDTYFIVTNGTMQVSTSKQYDGTIWPALAVAFAQATSDNIAGPINLNDQLMLIKQASCEGWYDTETAPEVGSPFLIVPGAVGTYGTRSPDTIVSKNSSIYFLGSQDQQGSVSGIIQMMATSAMGIISPPAITYRISKLSKITDAFSYAFDMEGHTFYVTTFPSADWTLVYDISTKRFFEWSSYRESDSPDTVGRHAGNCYAFCYNKHLIGDYRNGNIYQMSSSFYTDAGQPIVSTWISDIYSDRQDLTNMVFHKLEISAEVGTGDSTQVAPPAVELSWSNDNADTWTKPYPVSMGFTGQYQKRLCWRRLGRGRNRVFKLRCSAPIRKIFGSAIMQVS